MKVSVLIPAYNSERHLPECLDSVLVQDFADLEIVIADNCSTDGTSKVIEAYAARDGRIRWWRNPENLGLIGNHNTCLREARGEYVKFVHADDKLLAASAIGQMAAALDANPRALLAGCRPHVTGTKSKPLLFSKRSGIFDGKQLIVVCLEQNTNLIGNPTLTMFRRDAARRGFDERFAGMLDFALWCDLLEQGDFAYLAEPLATWRLHDDQETAKHGRTGSADQEHLQFMESWYAKPWLKKAATPRMLFAQIYYLEKKYGDQASPLTSAMRSQLSPRQFASQRMKHKASRPFLKLGRKAGWERELLAPHSAVKIAS